ncbi:two-component system regulatory protein YycI [Paenibacillus koleovorans]|uniref:two-component system regulatory protein YycI n=1 Tax=Paenibacillus koleovorans TaxID=121608 RepID=UPI000FD92F55|nr:two-component system regulatory protein YycI [Paenibacillus koleovorans]
MDWSRAKTILIFSFLLLNLTLGYELWANQWLRGEGKTVSADMAVELNRLMQSRNIRVEMDIPTDVPKMQEIVVKWMDGNTYGRKVTLAQPLKYNRFLSKGSLKDLANHSIPNAEAYRYDPVSAMDGVYRMNQLYLDYPMFDVTMELFMTDGEISAYKQSFVEVEKPAEDKEAKKVIPAYTVLRTLTEKFLQTGAVIQDIRLGYHGQLFDSEKKLLVPTWRVAVQGGELYYVHGFRGDVENAQLKSTTTR